MNKILHHVIILNAKDDIKGFPSKIEDDSVLKPFLAPIEKKLYAEERRVFYVALTRPKKTCRIMAPLTDYSIFVHELKLNFNVPVVWQK